MSRTRANHIHIFKIAHVLSANNNEIMASRKMKLYAGFPPGRENREEKCDQASQAIFFRLKVRGKVRELFFKRALISNKITQHNI